MEYIPSGCYSVFGVFFASHLHVDVIDCARGCQFTCRLQTLVQAEQRLVTDRNQSHDWFNRSTSRRILLPADL